MTREEAIKVIKDNWPEGRVLLKMALDILIPELKESKDEKIRKGLIDFLNSPFINENITDEKVAPWLAWLEKQGELQNKLKKYRNYLVNEAERWSEKQHDKMNSKVGAQDCIGHANAFISARAEFEEIFDYDSLNKKQGEQNQTLPKWKYKKDNTPLLRDSLILNKYGYVAKSPSGALVSDVWVLDFDELAKLPKEEYEKQGEQKPTCLLDNSRSNVSFPFKAKVKSSDTIVTIHDGQLSPDGKEWIKYQSDNKDGYKIYEPNNLELVYEIEQNPAWSEEDEKILKTLINDAEKTLFAIKQEERYDIMSGLSEIYIERLRWLKSLKERYTWKPSDEQMEFLWKYAEQNNYDGAVLTSLFRDLKKLRKE